MVEIRYVRCPLCGWQKPYERNRRKGETLALPDKIRYQWAVLDDGSALITLRESHPIQKGKRKGVGGFTNSGRIPLAQAIRDPEYADLVDGLRRAVDKIKRELD